MKNYYQLILLFLKRLLFLLVLYTLSRLFFFVLNNDYFSDVDFPEILLIFIAGLRFDIAAIIFTNFIFLLLLLPGLYQFYQHNAKKVDLLYFVINAIALLSNFIDARFFDFINKRSTTAVFNLLNSNKNVWLLLPQFIKDYWYVAGAWLLLMACFWKWMPVMGKINLQTQKLTWRILLYQTAVFIGICGLTLLGARGTKLKPISVVDAACYSDLKEVPLVLNTPFSIIKSFGNDNLKPLHYFEEDSLLKIYNPIHPGEVNRHLKKINVIIFILESFSKEYSGYLTGSEGYTPMLDSMLRQSLVFPNAFANGTQSFEAMPAIIAGIPSLMDRPYSGSNYADNIIESLPGLLKQEGYFTSFYHGGNNGTMEFDNFAHISGIESYKGRNEYNNDDDFDGFWGIWDEPYLQYFAGEIEKLPQPFISAIFTLSSHHPYSIPEKHRERFSEERLPILKSIRYTDYALGEFFRKAKKMPWYHQTLFVFTADHAAQAIKKEYNTTTGMFFIPIAFYSSSDTLLKGIDSTICQQIDIMPSVLDYLGYNKTYFAFGESLFRHKAGHRSISYVNGVYQFIEGNFGMLFDGEKVISFYNRINGKIWLSQGSPSTITDAEIKRVYIKMENNLKAILQCYNNCLISNRTSFFAKNQSTQESSFVIQENQVN